MPMIAWSRFNPCQSTPAFIAAMVLIAALGLALRLPGLGRRPLHVDEAVQACKAGILYDSGEYRYNPREFHGPTLYYATLPVLWLSGAERAEEAGARTFRLVPVVFGVGLILLGLLLRRGTGRPAALAAALLTAVSPAFTYYSRYYIQEMVLVFLTFLLILAGWHGGRGRGWFWAGVAGVTVGLMHATKETWVLAAGAMALALGGAAWWRRALGEPARRGRRWRRPGPVALAAGLALGVAWLLYSGWPRDGDGLLNSFRAFGYYAARAAQGEGSAALHRHPWHTYPRLLSWAGLGPGPWWSEALVLGLGLAGMTAVVLGHTGAGARCLAGIDRPLARFLALYTILLTVIYCAIPYKTPWNLLSFYHGFVLMAGIGAVAVIRLPRGRWARGVLGAVLLGLVAQLGWQAWRGAHRFEVDARNPYVYAHTSTDALRLVERLNDLAAVDPDGRAILIRIESAEYWPLPFYLRGFARVGYYEGEELERQTQATSAPVVITRPDREVQVEGRLRGDYQKEYYGLRPEVLLTVYIRRDLWDELMRKREGAP